MPRSYASSVLSERPVLREDARTKACQDSLDLSPCCATTIYSSAPRARKRFTASPRPLPPWLVEQQDSGDLNTHNRLLSVTRLVTIARVNYARPYQ